MKKASTATYLLLLVLIVGYVGAQVVTDCSDAPNEQTRQVCMRFRMMDKASREKFEREADSQLWPPSAPGSAEFQRPLPISPGHRGQAAYDPLDCMTLQCLCPFFNGRMIANDLCEMPNGEPLKMAYRKEYRLMTDDERFRFHSALQRMKQSGEYDQFSQIHKDNAQQSSAHSGPGFLGWHREYLKRLEIKLRLIDPSIALPFWDSVLDSYLPDPRDSILFTDLFAGTTDWNGFVTTGPFAYWRTLEGAHAIKRNIGQQGSLFSEHQINQVLEQSNVEYVLAYTVPVGGCPFPVNYGAIEYTHANIHLYIGGDLAPPLTSGNDPSLFFTHHTFVDRIWEDWRQLKQPRWVRETSFAPDMPQCSTPYHFSYSEMRPFPGLINRDGLSNAYTDQMYRYGPRPTCSREAPACGSKYLFCDWRGFPHCVAKVKLGGLCQGFEGLDACYNGQCYFGRCMQGPTPAPWRPPTPPPTPPPTRRPMVARPIVNFNRTIGGVSKLPVRQVAKATQNATPKPRVSKLVNSNTTGMTFNNCYNKNPCCDMWAQLDECTNNPKYMVSSCAVSCKGCIPSFAISGACKDKHVSCKQWKAEGQCTNAKGALLNFIIENCCETCSFGSFDKNLKCPKPKKKTGALNTVTNFSKKVATFFETNIRKLVA
uniref:ShKT domain-containing protein n=1 Tax=Rhabditophanes sp. KR3021 TaxID=114890 RepID=A0AC35TPE1_9BILA